MCSAFPFFNAYVFLIEKVLLFNKSFEKNLHKKIQNSFFNQARQKIGRMADSETLIYEVEIGSSVLQMVGRMLLEVNYFQIPMILLFIFISFSFYIFFRFKDDLVMSSIQFVFCCLFISITNTLNQFLSQHWQQFFFKQNYFDPNCVFLFTFWTIPFSIISVLIIFSLFIDLCKSISVHKYFDTLINQNNSPNSKNKSEK